MQAFASVLFSSVLYLDFPLTKSYFMITIANMQRIMLITKTASKIYIISTAGHGS